MIKSDKKVNDLKKNLLNSDILFVSAAIDLLRDSEPFDGAIGILVNHYDNCTEKSVKQSISGFLNDIKDTGARKEIIESLHNSLSEETKSMVITSCWHSGLDYSAQIDDFTELFLKYSYNTAFECLTVIEQSLEKIEESKKQIIIKRLKSSLKTQPDEKTALVNELINVLTQ